MLHDDHLEDPADTGLETLCKGFHGITADNVAPVDTVNWFATSGIPWFALQPIIELLHENHNKVQIAKHVIRLSLAMNQVSWIAIHGRLMQHRMPMLCVCHR